MAYQAVHYLLQVNLCPRQFLGAAGGLASLGAQQVDGAAYIRLQASPARDESAQADPYLGSRQSRPLIDFYYDAARRAVARVTLTTATTVTVCSVDGWQNFGTESQWPARIKSAQEVRRGTMAPEKPYLVAIEGFTLEPDAELAAIAQRVIGTPFFYAPTTGRLRTPATYAKAVADNPQSLSDQVVYAQALLIDQQAKKGWDCWKGIESKLARTADKTELSRVLASRGAASAGAHSSSADKAAWGEMLLKWANEPHLGESTSESTLAAVFESWRSLRTDAVVRDAVAPVQAALLDRFARSKNLEVAQGLLEMEAGDFRDAEAVRPILNGVADDPLPDAGYDESEVSVLIAAALERNGWSRAEGWLSKLAWSADTPPDGKASAVALLALLTERPKAAGEEVAVLSMAIDQFTRADEKLERRDPTTHIARTRLAAKLACLLLESKAATGADPASLIAATAKAPGSEAYWTLVIHGLLNWKVLTPADADARFNLVADLGDACEQNFQRPDFKARTLIKIGRSPFFRDRRHSPLSRIDYFNRAFAAAVTDGVRLLAVEEIAGTLGNLGQHEQAAQVVGSLRSSLVDANSQAAADALLNGIAKDKALHTTIAAKREKQVRVDRLEGQVAYLNERLTELQRLAKPQSDLDSVRQALDRAEQELIQARDAAR